MNRFVALKIRTTVLLAACAMVIAAASAEPGKAKLPSNAPSPKVGGTAIAPPAAKATEEARQAHSARGAVFGSWQVICGEAQSLDPAQRCRIAQSVLSERGDQRVLLVRVYGKPSTMMVSTPHSIFLKPGLSYQAEEGPQRFAPFETCNEEGCHLGVQLDDDLLAEMRGAKRLLFSFFDGAAHRVTLPLSLDGFGEAYAALKDGEKR